MDDIKIWLYVIVGVIYFVSRLMKQKGKSQVPDIDDNESMPTGQGQSGKRPMSFEELLKEITEAKKPSQPAYQTPRPSPKPAYVDYDDDLKDEIDDLEDVDYKPDSKVFEIFEKAKKEAFNRPSLEETMKLSDQKQGYNRFKEFDIKKKGTLLKEYASDLKTKGGFRRAVVLNEILNRKF